MSVIMLGNHAQHQLRDRVVRLFRFLVETVTRETDRCSALLGRSRRDSQVSGRVTPHSLPPVRRCIVVS